MLKAWINIFFPNILLEVSNREKLKKVILNTHIYT